MTFTHPLIDKFRSAGQGHVFAFFDSLDDSGKRGLLGEASEIDLGEIERLNRTLVEATGAGLNLAGLEPAPHIPLPEKGGNACDWARAASAGEAALEAGRVAAFTVAGGQGTRLGYDGPKGTFPVTPVRRHSLFQVFAEKLLAAGRRHGRPLHWFVMTSHQNHAATEAFFADRRFFGLDPARVHFFRQGRLPAVDFGGKILLESPGSVALSPDGHGGSLRALERSGAVDLLAREGVDILSYFQVDNPLVRCVDPAFIGWHVLSASEMSSKMVPKAHAGERLGHFCMSGGRLSVVEYSDLPVSLQRETDASGRLRFQAGSIAVHVLDREFVRRMASCGELPFHRAEKRIASVDSAGRPVKPEKPNGIKFELFVFDALPFARNAIVVETRRADDFSPVKNAEGADSPETCRRDQLRQFSRWLLANGAAVPVDKTGLPPFALEVSPLFGFDDGSFAESWSRLSKKPEIAEGLFIG